VRKSTTMLQHHITVGRALTSDVVLQANEVSKLHGFFQKNRGRMELSDAGSRNGTWVGKQRLVPKGPALAVHSGDIVTFGPFAFYYYDADTCWECLHKWPKGK
jgi:pSer/pThr/pTyr-binding forkhead associated (FHA) protein